MKLTKGKVIGSVAVMALLAGAFFLGGGRPVGDAGGMPTGAPVSTTPVPTVFLTSPPPSMPPPSGDPTPAEPSDEPTATVSPAASVPPPAPIPSAAEETHSPADPEPSMLPSTAGQEPEHAEDGAYTCTLSISCAALLEHSDELEASKLGLVPEDGMLFPAAEVTFYEGESVFEVLRREMKLNKIHLEFVEAPLYQSAYIEGIGNLYEFDCGELSGWVYRVNGTFPSYGCSRYQLQDGDIVEWLYTCDLGRDVGGNNGWGGVAE